MFSKTIRILKIVLFIFFTIIFILLGKVPESILLIALTLLNIYNWIRYGSINVSLRYMKKNDLKKAKKYLNETIKIDWLSRTYKGYYYFIKAYVEIGEENLSEAVNCYEKALDYGLRTENDEGIVYLQLAVLSGISGKLDIATDFLKKAKKKKIKSQLLDQIQRVEEVLEKQKDSKENLMIDYLSKIT